MATVSHRISAAHPGAGVPWQRESSRVQRSFSSQKRAELKKGPAGVGSYVDELLATQTSTGSSGISGYTLCANEWESFALPGTCDVAYGANGAFAFRSAQSGTITFNNATFGDPAPGVAKKGYYRLSGGQRFYAHANHLYSVAALTDNTGAVVERYRYDAYGQRTVLAADGTTVRAASSYENLFGFTGRYLDKETGLWYFRARYYSGTLGRFVSRDTWMSKPINTKTQLIKPKHARQGPNSSDGYPDGPSFYQAYFIPTKTDPSGMACGVVAVQNTEFSGHAWYEYNYNGESGASGTWKDSGESKHGSSAETHYELRKGGRDHRQYQYWATFQVKQGALQFGSAKGTKCCDATCPQIHECLDAYAKQTAKEHDSGERPWNLIMNNCRDYAERALEKCCLKKSLWDSGLVKCNTGIDPDYKKEGNPTPVPGVGWGVGPKW